MKEFMTKMYKIQQRIDKHIGNKTMTDDDTIIIIEGILDTLVEVGNGVTDEMLHKQCDYLFAFRDLWMKNKIKQEV